MITQIQSRKDAKPLRRLWQLCDLNEKQTSIEIFILSHQNYFSPIKHHKTQIQRFLSGFASLRETKTFD